MSALSRREFLQVSVSAAGGLAVSLVIPGLAAAAGAGAARPKLPPAVLTASAALTALTALTAFTALTALTVLLR